MAPRKQKKKPKTQTQKRTSATIPATSTAPPPTIASSTNGKPTVPSQRFNGDQLGPALLAPGTTPNIPGPPLNAATHTQDRSSSEGSLPSAFSERTAASCTTIQTSNTPARHHPDPLMSNFCPTKGNLPPPLNQYSSPPEPSAPPGETISDITPTAISDITPNLPPSPTQHPPTQDNPSDTTPPTDLIAPPVDDPPPSPIIDPLVDTPPSSSPSPRSNVDGSASSSSESSDSNSTEESPVQFGEAPSSFEFYSLKKRFKILRRHMDQAQHTVMQLESYNRATKTEYIEYKNKSNRGWNNLHTRLNDVGPKWREGHETTLKGLITSLTKCGHQQVENLLKLEKIDKDTLLMRNNMDDLHMSKIDRNEYNNVLSLLHQLEQADTDAKTHCSDRRHSILKSYKQDYHKLEDKIKQTTTIAQEAQDSVSNLPSSTNSLSTRTTKSIMEQDISSLQHSVMDLQLKLDNLLHQVETLEAKPPSSPIHAITDTSSSAPRHSHGSKSRTVTFSTKDARNKRKPNTTMHRTNEEDKNPTRGSRDRSAPVSATRPPKPWEPPTHEVSPPTKKQRQRPPPLEDFTATTITSLDLFAWTDNTLPSRERPSARYCERITSVPLAMAEHNHLSKTFTIDWQAYRDKTLRTMHTHIPSTFTITQIMTFTNLVSFLQTTSYLELGYSIAKQGEDIDPRDVWPVTCPLCDPACHLQTSDPTHDGHMSSTLDQLRNCPTRKKQNDKLTHDDHRLRKYDKYDNMLNAQELYLHLRLYSDKCFLHAAMELILDALYPALQAKMHNWRHRRDITFPPVEHA